MSTDLATAPVADEHESHAHHGPSDLDFVKTAVVLAAITAVEVAWSYLPWDRWNTGKIWTILEIGGLLIMMAFKFWIVAGVFMHLKFDKKLLTGVFYAGLVLAVSVYLAVLVTFQVFANNTPGFAP